MAGTKKRTWIETLGMFGNLRFGVDKHHRKSLTSHMSPVDHLQDRMVDKNQLVVLIELASRRESQLFLYNQADKDKVKKDSPLLTNCPLKCKYHPNVNLIRV